MAKGAPLQYKEVNPFSVFLTLAALLTLGNLLAALFSSFAAKRWKLASLREGILATLLVASPLFIFLIFWPSKIELFIFFWIGGLLFLSILLTLPAEPRKN